MTVAVVDLLQIVQVKSQQSELRDAALSSLLKNLAFQAFRYDFLSDRVIAEL
jgi:hypothetical protein